QVGGAGNRVDRQRGAVGYRTALACDDYAQGVVADGQNRRVDGEAGGVAAGGRAVQAPLIGERTGAAGDRRETGVSARTDGGVDRPGGGYAGIDLEDRA